MRQAFSNVHALGKSLGVPIISDSAPMRSQHEEEWGTVFMKRAKNVLSFLAHLFPRKMPSADHS